MSKSLVKQKSVRYRENHAIKIFLLKLEIFHVNSYNNTCRSINFRKNIKCVKFSLLENVMGIRNAGTVRSLRVQIPGRKSDVVEGRTCTIRKTEEGLFRI